MGFDPSQHPRGAGGLFVQAGSKGAAAEGAKKKLGKDAKLDSHTIRRYQKRHGLKVDGVIGHQTAASLLGHKSAKNVKTGSMTKAQHDALRKFGHDKKPDKKKLSADDGNYLRLPTVWSTG